MKKTYKCLSFISIILLSSCEISFGSSGTSSSSGGNTSQGTDSSDSQGGTEDSSSTTPVDPNLLWSDEFNGNSLNTNYWEQQIGDGTAYGIPGWGNGEAQYYQGDNTEVRDGNLVITARKENVGGKEYTSSRIRTAGKVKVLYGRVEARMSLPLGQGLWPAFWMLPESDNPYGGWPNSGEIDIMEARGRVTDQTSGALHFNQPGSNAQKYETATHTLTSGDIGDYHVYAIEWEEDQMRWYVDEDLFMTLNSDQWYSNSRPSSSTAPFNWDFHILFNFAVGGHFDGYRLPEAGFESAELKVDYVRVYKL